MHRREAEAPGVPIKAFASGPPVAMDSAATQLSRSWKRSTEDRSWFKIRKLFPKKAQIITR